jgi:tetratricopeptide (TPR) repeat protein
MTSEVKVIEQLLQQAAQARKEHRSADAKRDLTEAVEACRAHGTQLELAGALKALGQIERDLQHNDVALKLYQEAAAIYRTAGDPLALAHTVRHVGDILLVEGRHALAEPCYQEALTIYRGNEKTAPLDLANTIRGMAMLKQETRNVDEAKALWEEARTLYAQVNVEAGVAESSRRIAQLTK